MENKFYLKKFFSNKKLKYGGYSLLVTLAGIALVVLFNYGMTVLENKFDLKIDTTQNKKYSLSDQTKSIISGLTKDITITTTYPAGSEDKDIVEILQKIKSLSSHVTIQNIDPDLNPVFMQRFETGNTKVAAGDVIVSDKDGKLFRILDDNAQYSYTTDPNTYQQSKSQIKIEGSVVTAVNFIETGYIPTVYLVQGHGEATTDTLSDLSSSLSSNNYSFVTINITQEPDKIKAGDIIMFCNPQKDITEQERDILKPLIQKGGRFYFLLSPQYAAPGKLPNLELLLKLFDVSLKSGVVIEGNQANEYMPTMPYALKPNIQDHDITTPIKSANFPLVIPFSGALNLPDSPPDSSIKITSLLKSSDQAYLKSMDSLTSAKTLADLAKGDSDEAGPFNLAVAIDKTNGSNAEDDAKIVISYSTDFAMESGLISTSVAYENNDYFMNSVGWLQNASKNIYVRPKSISTAYMNIQSAVEFWVIVILSIVLVPVLMLVAGIVIYQRRKHL